MHLQWGLRWLALASVAGVVALGGEAPAKEKVVGNWLIDERVDAFGDGNRVVAIHSDGRADTVAVRCLRGKASFAIMEDLATYGSDDIVLVKFRAGTGEIIDTVGAPVNNRTLEVLMRPGMLDGLAKARKFAFRITTGLATFDRTYSARANDQVVDLVVKACPATLR